MVKEIKITLTGKPVSTNHAYKSTCRGKFVTVYMAADAKDIKQEWQIQAQQQYKGKILVGDVEVTVRFYHKDKRKHDIDNYFKLLFDSLSGILWEDDVQITRLTAVKSIDKENPRIEVVVN